MKDKRLGKRVGKSRARSPETLPDGRDRKSGRFLPQNTAALKHGLYQFKKSHSLPLDLQPQVDAFVNAVLSDQGGEGECSALQLGLVRRIAEVEAICRLLARDLAEHGPLSVRGRTRSATTTFLSAVDRFNKLAAQLGLPRKTKQAPSLDDFLKQQAQQNAGGGDV